MSFSKNKRELAAIEFKILEETIRKRKLLEKEWESRTDITFEDGQKIKIKTDINFSNENGFTLLDLAIISGDIDKATGLIEQGAKSDRALLLSMVLGSQELMSIIFHKDMPFDYSDLTGTKAEDPTFSISSDVLEHLKELLKRKITDGSSLTIHDKDDKERNPLHHFAFLDFETFKQNILTIPNETLNNWINAKDKSGYSPLYYACFTGNVEYIHYLVKRGANIEEDFIFRKNKTHRTPLFLSTIVGRQESVQKLIELGAKVTNDIVGKSPLSFAITHNNVELIQLILHQELDLRDQSDAYQRNLMHILAKYGNKETCEYMFPLLLTAGLLDQKNVFGVCN